MKKPVASRIFGLAALYCVIFIFIVILQFSNTGNFSLPVGAMTIRGRYLQPDPAAAQQTAAQSTEENSGKAEKKLNGTVRIFFGGLEYNVINPESMIIAENTVRFNMDGKNALVFISIDSSRGHELQITGQFSDNNYETAIPITPRRSSIIRDNGQIGILFNSERYFFSGEELENSAIVLTKANAFVSYRSKGKQKSFDTGDYIIAQAQNFDSTLADWQNQSYAHWRQNAPSLQSDDDVIAYCSEALLRNSFTQAVGSIPSAFLTSSRHSYRSAGYVGGMAGAYNTFTASEREKISLITRLTRERSPEIFKEEHTLDFLLTRGNLTSANDFINTINSLNPELITSGYCAGLLEAYSDFKRWRPQSENPVNIFTDKILIAVSESLNRDTDKKLVYASNNGNHDLDYSTRLGKALVNWADAAQNTEWAAVGRSLVLSALLSAGPGAGNLYCILAPGNYFPRAAQLADNGLWTWTVSPSVNASYIDGNLNISVSFPQSSSHYLLISGVRPFIKLRIHDMDWRTDNQFERYDSSGWVYHQQEQILVLKLKHRSTIENVRIVYVQEQIPEAVEEENAEAGGEAQ